MKRITQPSQTLRRALQALLLLAMVLWCAIQLVAAIETKRQRFAIQEDRFPPRWQRGDPVLEELLVLLDEVEPRIPAGEMVALHPIYRQARYRTYVRMWAAYRMPRHHIVPIEFPHAVHAEWAISFRTRLRDEGWRRVGNYSNGMLYRREASHQRKAP